MSGGRDKDLNELFSVVGAQRSGCLDKDPTVRKNLAELWG